MSRRILAAALPLLFWPALLVAQLGEVHLGALASYGTASSYGVGAGLIGGISAGRLVYVGARWVYYAGRTERRPDSTGTPYDVRTQAQIFAADLGLQYPLGAVEIVGGVTIGATRFGQHTNPVTRGSTAFTDSVGTEFLIAPNFWAQIRVGRLLLIPEVMYSLGGAPDLQWSAAHQGLLFAIRVVVPLEVNRIRR